MAEEIERKFLVNGEAYRHEASGSSRIAQGYLWSAPGHTVRVRVRGDRGFLTIKGPGSEDGTSRFEWEKEISADDARSLLKLCGNGIIDKTRWLVDFGAHTFHVDEFHGDNEGLVVAELELSSAAEPYERPAWLREEVTGDKKYYNSALSACPFKDWK